MEICSIQDDSELKTKNNAQRHSPRPIHNDWHYFRPTLVFAGHYLSEMISTQNLQCKDLYKTYRADIFAEDKA
jgi:hypothetical protein